MFIFNYRIKIYGLVQDNYSNLYKKDIKNYILEYFHKLVFYLFGEPN